MRILVTGGAGFIGSHLVERLIARGDRVTVLDDLSTGALANLSGLCGHANLDVVTANAGDAAVAGPLVSAADAVVHLAASVGVRRVVEQTVKTIENNVGATRAVLDAAAVRRTRVLLASSSEVYGLSEDVPFREDAPISLGATSSPRWSYACAKAMDEWLGLAFFRERRVPVTVARLFNTVGPRQTGRYGMVLPRFVAQALAGEALCVHGTGAQTRCFSHVRDTVEALVRLLDADGAVGQVVNVGSTRELAILDLARKVVALTSSQSRVLLVPFAEIFGEAFDDPARRVPDVARLRALTGFVPDTPVEDIILDVVSHVREGRMGASAPLPRAAG